MELPLNWHLSAISGIRSKPVWTGVKWAEPSGSPSIGQIDDSRAAGLNVCDHTNQQAVDRCSAKKELESKKFK